MLTFFRRIRKGLLGDGATTKYLLYAVGEIALVVIGILIALQINNWNESRKERVEEREVLMNLKKALESDLDNQFMKHLLQSESDVKKINLVLENIENNLPFNDSSRFYLKVLTSDAGKVWTPQVAAYNRLESKGLDLISNDRLLDSILNIYSLDYYTITRQFNNYLRNVYDYGRPIIRRKFLAKFVGETWDGLFPVDYSSLVEDVEFLNTLTILRDNNRVIIVQLSESKAKVERVIQLINEELDESR